MRTYRGHIHTGHRNLGPGILSVDEETGLIAEITPDPSLKDPHLPYLIPGFVDLHNHGGDGGAFPTGTLEECRRAAMYHRKHGSTTLLASLVSAAGDHLVAQTALLADLADEGLIAGIHMEGPFIAECRCGAQDPAAIIPGDPELFSEVIKAGRGYLKQITFAPETDNAVALLDLCAEHGVIASLGHTDADFTTTTAVIAAAAARGVTVTATHLFNAMPQLHHRNPGPIAALMESAGRGVAGLEIIADGVHLSDDTVAFLDTATDHAFLITDAMEAAGKPDGQYILGSLDVTVSHGVARLTPGTGAIAGGTSTIASQVSRHWQRGWSLDHVVAMSSMRAATILGVTPPGLVIGGPADVVELNCQGQFQRCLAAGAEFTV
ncbi:N-acetylglucosamine-6-phosphate deacetylase [Corynebacterium poyangense]|uniref:N-acetylglucosamine-6-phosphate deacetylase n=1 Tax=Corynebacterium poyangense TaxID=2684405 RepID=UPI001CCB54D7|nr:amidohydrolase family protein [Corynebacterium poyangense]